MCITDKKTAERPKNCVNQPAEKKNMQGEGTKVHCRGRPSRAGVIPIFDQLGHSHLQKNCEVLGKMFRRPILFSKNDECENV